MRRNIYEGRIFVFRLLFFAAEAYRLLAVSLLDYLLQSVKSAAADKEDIFRIYLNEILSRVLSAALRRHICHSALENLQQCLLDALARNIACDRAVFTLARDFVYFVDINNTFLCKLHIIIRRLNETEQYVFHILADITRFRECRGIGYGKRNLQELCQRLCKKSLAHACRTYEQYIAFLNFHAVILLFALQRGNSLVMIVYGDAERFFCRVLTDDIFIKLCFQLGRLGQLGKRRYFAVRHSLHVVIYHSLCADYAVVAYINPGYQRGNKPCRLTFGYSAKCAAVFRFICLFLLVRHFFLRSPTVCRFCFKVFCR